MDQENAIQEQLHDAVMEGNLEEVQQLVAQGADINQPYGKHNTSMLLQAQFKRHKDIIQFLLDNGVNVNHNEMVEGTALMFAAGDGDVEQLKLFLKYGADPNVRLTVTGETALHNAAHSNNLETAKLLIEAGADVNARLEINARTQMRDPKIAQGETPLHFAAHRLAEPALIQLLLDAGADKTIETAQGETPLAYAERYDRPEEILELLR